jgi:hypothetical protein
MPAYTLAQAIAATGKSRSTLIRAIRSGKLSATRDESGTYLVEPSELHRIFQAITDGMPPDLSNGVPRHAELIARLEAEQAKNIIFQDTIADLRRRLDDEAAERRRLTALLADLRAPQPAPPAAPRRWWRW